MGDSTESGERENKRERERAREREREREGVRFAWWDFSSRNKQSTHAGLYYDINQ